MDEFAHDFEGVVLTLDEAFLERLAPSPVADLFDHLLVHQLLQLEELCTLQLRRSNALYVPVEAIGER